MLQILDNLNDFDKVQFAISCGCYELVSDDIWESKDVLAGLGRGYHLLARIINANSCTTDCVICVGSHNQSTADLMGRLDTPRLQALDSSQAFSKLDKSSSVRLSKVADESISRLLRRGQVDESVDLFNLMSRAKQACTPDFLSTTLVTYKVVNGILLQQQEKTYLPWRSDHTHLLYGGETFPACYCHDVHFGCVKNGLYDIRSWKWKWQIPTDECTSRRFICHR